MKENHKYILLFLCLAVAILWQALMPGYILGLDMVFAPDMRVMVNPDGFSNGLPVAYLIQITCAIIPAWLAQKIILLGLFFSIGYLAFRFLPVARNNAARMFAALIYLLNPFVYSRFLAGQWEVLAGYALLPLFVSCLLSFGQNFNLRSGLKLFGSLFLISLFSIHFFAMAAMVLAVWLAYRLAGMIANDRTRVGSFLKNIAVCGILFLVAGSYWLVPAMNRASPLEQRFGPSHWQAFSAGGYKNIDPLLNIASLNGFWGERNPWAGYFLWPQDFSVFWFAFAIIMVFVLAGVIGGLKNKSTRSISLFFAIIGGLAFITATGVGETVFKNLNVWLFENVSFWAGFRDSQKFSGFLALSYAYFAGMGFIGLLDWIGKKKPALVRPFLSVIFILPILFGYLMWGGFYKQARPVWYPESWFAAKSIIDADTSGGKVLFLPWHGYFSLGFNNNIVSANPAKRFFGEKIISSENVELDGVYGQTLDKAYVDLDALIRSCSTQKLVIFQKKYNIKYIISIQDINDADDLSYDFLFSPDMKPNTSKELERNDIVVYKINR